MRLWLAIRVFWKALVDRNLAESFARILDGQPPKLAHEPPAEAAKPTRPAPASRGGRSEALNLLAALQREARFLDMVKEPLVNYSDAQIGAAARDVLRDCDKVIDRMFGVEPLLTQSEGESVEVPPGFEAACYRLTGKVEGDPPYQGALVHHGWRTTRCEVPQWTGSDAVARVIAPAEVELQ
jgi:hypothetical protein